MHLLIYHRFFSYQKFEVKGLKTKTIRDFLESQPISLIYCSTENIIRNPLEEQCCSVTQEQYYI